MSPYKSTHCFDSFVIVIALFSKGQQKTTTARSQSTGMGCTLNMKTSNSIIYQRLVLRLSLDGGGDGSSGALRLREAEGRRAGGDGLSVAVEGEA